LFLLIKINIEVVLYIYTGKMAKWTTVFADGTIEWICRHKRCPCDTCKRDLVIIRRARWRERYRKKREEQGFTVVPKQSPKHSDLQTETQQKPKPTRELKYGSQTENKKEYFRRYYEINGDRLRQYGRDYHSKRTLARALSASTAPAPEMPLDANPATSC
jgi:hypothetical protein